MDTSKSNSILLPLSVVTLLYSVTLVFYRLYLHPLAKFPGPKIAAVTRYLEAYYDIIQNGQYTSKISEMHRQYGPIIRISPYELHVSDPSFFEKIYRQEGRWDKYAWSYDAFTAKASTICTPDHDLHKQRRAALNRFFSKPIVSGRQDILQALVNKLCSRLNEHVGSTVNIGSSLSALTRDVATDYILGKSYNSLERQDFNEGITSIFQSSGFIWRITKHIRWFGPIMKSIPMSVIERWGDKGAKEFLVFVNESMQITRDIMDIQSAQSGDDEVPRTLVTDILQSRLPPEEKSFERISDDIATILGAAFETTASTMRLILYHLYTDADILQQLRAELTEALMNRNAEGNLTLSELEQLPYLTGVIMEGLRLSPGIATRMARIAPDRDLVYNHWIIPRGTPVGMTTLLMHTDEAVYPDPRRFDPERWTEVAKRKDSEKIFAPFSRGTRMCLGMQLAWAELYLTISAIVQRFDFELKGISIQGIDFESDQFIIGAKDQNNIRAYVS